MASAWAPPTFTPSAIYPNNAPAPINTGGANQIKSGSLIVNGAFSVAGGVQFQNAVTVYPPKPPSGGGGVTSLPISSNLAQNNESIFSNFSKKLASIFPNFLNIFSSEKALASETVPDCTNNAGQCTHLNINGYYYYFSDECSITPHLPNFPGPIVSGVYVEKCIADFACGSGNHCNYSGIIPCSSVGDVCASPGATINYGSICHVINNDYFNPQLGCLPSYIPSPTGDGDISASQENYYYSETNLDKYACDTNTACSPGDHCVVSWNSSKQIFETGCATNVYPTDNLSYNLNVGYGYTYDSASGTLTGGVSKTSGSELASSMALPSIKSNSGKTPLCVDYVGRITKCNPVPGACTAIGHGGGNLTYATTGPSYSNLCSSGIPSEITTASFGHWSWSCAGLRGGATDYCQQNNPAATCTHGSTTTVATVGDSTWAVPPFNDGCTGGTVTFKVYAAAGGGGGGGKGGGGCGTGEGGGGGGAGGFKNYTLSVSEANVEDTYYIHVGAGGAGGAGGPSGNTGTYATPGKGGENSYVNNPDGTELVGVKGGGGGGYGECTSATGKGGTAGPGCNNGDSSGGKGGGSGGSCPGFAVAPGGAGGDKSEGSPGSNGGPTAGGGGGGAGQVNVTSAHSGAAGGAGGRGMVTITYSWY